MKIYTILNFFAQTKAACKICLLNHAENVLFTSYYVRISLLCEAL